MPQELSGRLLGSRAPEAGILLQIATWFRLEVRTAVPDQVPQAARVCALSGVVPATTQNAVDLADMEEHQHWMNIVCQDVSMTGDPSRTLKVLRRMASALQAWALQL